MTAILAAAAVGLRANFTNLGLSTWSPGDRIVFSATVPGSLKNEDAVVHQVRRTGKYTEVLFSESLKQPWSPEVKPQVARQSCGECGGGSGFVPSLYITECALCYWPKNCSKPVTYPVLRADVRRVKWTYHIGSDGDARDLFRGLDADRRFVYGCEDCTGWNRSASTLTLEMAVVPCSARLNVKTPPAVPGFVPLFHPKPHDGTADDDDIAEFIVVIALMLATLTLILGLYWDLALRPRLVQKDR